MSEIQYPLSLGELCLTVFQEQLMTAVAAGARPGVTALHWPETVNWPGMTRKMFDVGLLVKVSDAMDLRRAMWHKTPSTPQKR